MANKHLKYLEWDNEFEELYYDCGIDDKEYDIDGEIFILDEDYSFDDEVNTLKLNEIKEKNPYNTIKCMTNALTFYAKIAGVKAILDATSKHKYLLLASNLKNTFVKVTFFCDLHTSNTELINDKKSIEVFTEILNTKNTEFYSFSEGVNWIIAFIESASLKQNHQL